MVRIVNGELIPDGDPRLASRAPVPPASFPVQGNSSRRLFPSTNGFFGAFSSSQSLLGYEVEWFWLLALVLVGLMYGPWSSLVIGFLLALYQSGAETAKRQPSPQQPQGRPTEPRKKEASGGKFGTLGDVRQDKM